MTRAEFLLEIAPGAAGINPVAWELPHPRPSPSSDPRSLCAVLLDEADHVTAADDVLLAGRCYGEDGALLDAHDIAKRLRSLSPDAWPQAIWGDFLLVRRDGAGLQLYRDLAGNLPCYWMDVGPDHYLVGTSCPALIAQANRRVQIDAARLGAALRWPDLSSEHTALQDVRDLLPGCRLGLQLGHRPRTELAWRHDACAAKWKHPAGQAPAKALRTAVMNCVSAQLADAQHPLLQLSGGLDSSILAAVLHEMGTPFRAVTLATRDAEGDERRFARAVAGHLGIALEERWADPAAVDIRRPRAPDMPKPTRRLFAQNIDAQVQAAAAGGLHDRIVTGGAGDSLFSYLLPGLATADHLCRLNLAGALRTASNEAWIHRESIWPVLGKAIAAAARPQGWRGDGAFLSGADGVAEPRHPWLEASRALPPGKRAHIASLVAIQPYLETMRNGRVAVLSPLMATPLIRFCLSVPSWRWVENGRNRALAREAFAPLLPPIVIRRRGKASYDRFLGTLLERNREPIRNMLLGGALADMALLDRPRIEHWFANGPALLGHRILTLAEAESWARHWLERALPAARASPFNARQRA